MLTDSIAQTDRTSWNRCDFVVLRNELVTHIMTTQIFSEPEAIALLALNP
jgi:hypothetical protein